MEVVGNEIESRSDEVRRAQRVRDDLAARVVELASLVHAAEAELSVLVAELDDTVAWHGHGYVSLPHWLGVNCGFSPSEAARRVRVAARCRSLPALASAAGEGRISVGVMDAACRVATVDNDARLAELCCLLSPAQALRTMAIARRVDADDDPEPAGGDATWLRKWWDDQSRLHLDGCLDAVDGALFETAFEAARAAGERDADAGEHVDGPEALVRMSESMLEAAATMGLTRDGSAFSVEVIIDADRGVCRYGTVHLSDRQAGRVSCDCRVHALIHQGDIGLSVGRDRRTASRAQRRALRLRDGGCAFPGCTQTRYVHAHHITFWDRGGRTDLDNLVLLCNRHHRLLHEGEYTAVMGDDRRPEFFDPNGRRIEGRAGPPPIVSARYAWHQRHRANRFDPQGARADAGGETLTHYALDVLIANLLEAA